MISRSAELIKYIPEKPISPVPVLLATGFGCPPEDYRIFMKVLSSKGFMVLCPTPKLDAEDRPKKWLFFTDVDLIKQRAILSTTQAEGYPNAKGIQQVDVVAHSKGAIDVVPVIKAHPENFRNLILVAPAGIHREMNLFTALYRSKKAEEKNKQDKVRWQATADYYHAKFGIKGEAVESYKKNRGSYYPDLITAVTKTIYPDFQGLREAGINIVVVAQLDDSVFPLQTYRQLLDRQIVELVEILGIHRAIKFDPAVANTIGDLLEKNGR